MATFKDYLTKDGQALITKMLAGSCKIRFTRVVFGDGYLPAGTDPRNVTEVISPKYESEAAAGKSGQVVTVSGVFTNQNFTEATYLREKGVYATDGEHEALMIYANNGDSAEYIEPSDTSLIEKVIRSVLQFAQDDIVSIEVASGIYVTVENYQQDMIVLENTITERFEKVTETITEMKEYECKIAPRYVTDIDVASGVNCIIVKWKDPGETFIDGVRVALWDGTKLVMNEDHYPDSVEDGTLVIDNTEKNKYSNEGFVVTGLTNHKNYYFRFFPYCVCGGTNDYSEENKFKGVAGLLPMDNVTNISAVQSNDKIVLKWTDPESPKVIGDASIYWKKTVVVYKMGSCPTSMEDGTVIEETTLNQYKTNGLEIYGIQNGTYYFRFFTVSTDGIINSSEEQKASCTVAFATVTVKAPSSDLYGKAVKLTVGSNTLTSTFSSSGTAVFSVPWTGTASIVCSISSGLADASLNIAAMTSYTVTIGYIKYVTWANGTDAEVKAMLDAHYANKIKISNFWAVGDTRSVSLTAMAATYVGESHRAQTVRLAILDFDHDDLVTAINGHSKAAITVGQVDCLMDAASASNSVKGAENTENGYMNGNMSAGNSWSNCSRRSWCNNVYLNALPANIKNLVKQVNKKTSAGNTSTSILTTSEKVFLLSEYEMFGTTTKSVIAEGTQYTYYKTASNRSKNPKWNGVNGSCMYWERSPNAGAYGFCSIYNNGTASEGNMAGKYGICPNFCL